MHRSLLRQLKKIIGFADDSTLPTLLAEAKTLAQVPNISPELSRLLAGLDDLLKRVDTTYQQADRDLALRSSSLEISSAELSEINRQMRQELSSRERALESLRSTISRLLPDVATGLATDSAADLESLSALVSELVRQRESSRRELANQKFALDQHAIVSITDVDGRILYANDNFCEISEFSRAELLGQTHHIVNAGYHDPSFFKQMWTTISNGKVWHGEVKNRSKSGGEFWVSATIVPFLDEHGKPYQYIAIRTNITSRKLAEAALLEAKESAEAASKAKSEFLANMSHEIRTPMNGIIGMTEFALDTELNEEQREYLTIVKSSSESLLAIINDILDFSKIEAGRLDIESVTFDAHKLVADTLKTLAMRAYEKNLELICDIDPNVPRQVIGDPGRLRQVLVNLIGNAIKFTPSGEIALSMKAESHSMMRPSGHLELHIAVADTGIGIPKDKQSLIFQAFSQEDSSTTRQYGGTGLGLTISNRLVNLMGGQMWVDSSPGQGSTFHFTIHLQVDQSVAFLEPHLGFADLKGYRILIVDDHPTNLKIQSRQLMKWGIEVEQVTNGPAALQRLYSPGLPFNCLLLDAHMPEMDGFMLARALVANPPIQGLPPMIMLSSGAMKGDAQICRDIGIAAYFSRPVLEDELLAALRQILQAAPIHTTKAETPTQLVTRHSLREGSRSLRVLLVEDNLVNQKLALGLLSRWGHQVELAEDGQQAIDQFKTRNFDVILMDVQLPVIGGLEATRQIREIEQTQQRHPMPIIAMTANAMQGDREKCLEAGMSDYISKPIRSKDLLAMLDKIGFSSVS